MPLLEYVKWERFNNVIEMAKIASNKSDHKIDNHFPEAVKMVKIGQNIKKIK